MANRKSMNRVSVLGNLSADPVEVKGQGPTMIKFTVVTNEQWKDRNNGETKEHTEYNRCVAYGQKADYLLQYAGKGDQVLVEGKNHTRKWDDDKGATHYTTEVVASIEVQIIRSANTNAQRKAG